MSEQAAAGLLAEIKQLVDWAHTPQPNESDVAAATRLARLPSHEFMDWLLQILEIRDLPETGR